MNDDYVVYGGSISLFTRKLEAAMRFYGAPFRLERKDEGNREELEARARTHQVPVLATPDGWMIADTTPILDLLDARFPARRLVPEGELGVLVAIVEEVLDEWVARVMVHFRWHYPENTVFIVRLLTGKDLSDEEAVNFPLAQWGPRACRATGTETETQQRAAEAEYFGLLTALETQLGETAFALGDRPTAADAMLLGGLRGHTNHDPVPDLSAFARVLEWERSGADAWDGKGELGGFPKATPFAEHVLTLARKQYTPFVLGNAGALARGEKAFEISTWGEPASYLARPYPERSRRMIQARIRDRLDTTQRSRVASWLEERGLADCFMP
jgi:glutathione S-transferase